MGTSFSLVRRWHYASAVRRRKARTNPWRPETLLGTQPLSEFPPLCWPVADDILILRNVGGRS